MDKIRNGTYIPPVQDADLEKIRNKERYEALTEEERAQIDNWGRLTPSSKIYEQKIVQEKGTPYKPIPTIRGMCYQWDDDFIYAMRCAMSTDTLDHFSPEELDLWYRWVNYQNDASFDADNSVDGAIGASADNIDKKPMTVIIDFTDDKRNNHDVGWRRTEITKTPATKPTNQTRDSELLQSLDDRIMDEYECREPRKCVVGCDTIVDVYPCPTNQ